MEFAPIDLGQIYIVRVDPGQDVLESIQSFLQQAGVRQAVVLGGYGTLAAYRLHWVTHNHIPTENLFRSGAGGIEILAMNGLVVDGRAHVHVALATSDGAFGGHLEPGCIAYVLCELVLAEVRGVTLSRRHVAVSIEGMGTGEISRLTFEPDRRRVEGTGGEAKDAEPSTERS